MQPEPKDSTRPRPGQDPAASPLPRWRALFLLCAALVLIDYIWLVGLGATAKLPAHTNYYDQLASAFSHGQLYLEEKPEPALLALSNPYDPAQRAGIRILMDVSLHDGKYYLYFGPAPALILMVARLVVPGRIGDEYLVLLFAYGIFLFQSLLIIRLWRRFFPDTSPWLVAGACLLAGLIAPFSSVAGRPNIYNAAITGGQFFFLAGLYSAFDALSGASISKWKLALAGLLWAAALACRITLIIPIGLMTVMVCIAILVSCGRAGLLSKTIPTVLALGLTLGLGLVVLGWYDWARFGSPWETGVKYQLAGPDLQRHGSELFSPAYVLQNLYNYGLRAPTIGKRFPYMYSATGKAKPILDLPTLPEIYHAERVTGILYTGPFLLLGIIPAIRILFTRPARSDAGNDERLFYWMVISLYGCFLSGLAFFAAFFWASERYLMDFLPGLVLLSAVGFWQLDRFLRPRPVVRLLCTAGGTLLIAVSIIVSTLLALGTSPLQY